MVRHMGKHTKRTPGYLPRMAAGAAPLALLLVGPAAALADTPSREVPLDLHQHGSSSDLQFTRDEAIATHDLPASAASNLHQALAPDAAGQSQTHDLRLGEPGRVLTGNDLGVHHTQPFDGAHVAGLDQSMRHGVRLPGGTEALSSSKTSAESGLAGRFSGELMSGTRVERTSADAVDLGRAGSVVANSDESVLGQFTGNLDVTRLESTERHSVSGDLGPVHTLAATSQSTAERTERFHGELSAADIAAARTSTAATVGIPVTRSQHVGAEVLGNPVIDNGWTVSGPPFTFSPG
ncbi:hypothetical protein SAMN05421854_1011152 [Amycolatopsis rubida]|uniref:Uncharacterized protein n=2 Tax=Amycolatopsis rubida TaxID=112413 RepID=A0A1I5FIG1_9PSEU|nr:hypothetical protein SAMN05421854_1011152 [Amycolatopsis rubida]